MVNVEHVEIKEGERKLNIVASSLINVGDSAVVSLNVFHCTHYPIRK